MLLIHALRILKFLSYLTHSNSLTCFFADIMPSYLIPLLVITMAWNISATLSNSGVLFKKTQNISQTNWETAVSRSSISSSQLKCAFQCVYWEGREGDCNAFKFDMERSQCLMAQVC